MSSEKIYYISLAVGLILLIIGEIIIFTVFG